MKNSFSLFLNIVLGLLFVGSVLFSYFFGNFGGISLKELNNQYIEKNSLKFEDLPKNIQNRYISKNRLKTYTNKSDDNLPKLFDDDGNPLNIEIKSEDDFYKILQSLQKKILFLEQENLSLSNDKEELLEIVKEEKAKNKQNQKLLLSSNLEKINEAEKQHFKNISTLTAKINDLQRENIRLTQQLNGKEDKLSLEVEKLKKELKKQQEEQKKSESELLKTQKAKFDTLVIENKELLKNIDLLKEKLKTSTSEYETIKIKLDKTISSLQDKINNLILEKNRLLTDKTKEILEIEEKNSKKLQEFKNIIKNNNIEKDEIKQKYKQTIAKIEEKYKNKIENINNQKREVEASLKEVQKKLNNEIQNNSKINNEIQLLKSKNIEIKTELQNKKDEILQLEDKIEALSKKEIDVNKKVEELVKTNEKKHNKNYKILNDKIAKYETDIADIEKANRKNIEILSSQKDDLMKKIAKYEDEIDKKDKDLKTANQELKTLKQKAEKLALNENDKLKDLKKSFEELQTSVQQREKEYEKIIKNLKLKIAEKDEELLAWKKDKEKLRSYILEITALKKSLKELSNKTKSKKLSLLDSIECDDMNSGNFKISSTCKKKVDKFLSKFSKDNFFEVIPIMGNGGFASLNKVKKNKQLGIPDKEIKRLTDLANIGLGRYRAKEGGWLIREKFGDDVKISYTVYSIEAKNKRGFIIRAYK
jgi:hypothetical protein